MPIPAKDNRINRISARQLVYNELKNWIVDNTLLPEEYINDSEIAKHFAVSRTPVREAILMLAREDFVKIVPSKGTQVSAMSIRHAVTVFEAVACLSKEIGTLAAKKHTAGNIVELENLNRKFFAASESGNLKLMMEADHAFHDYILKIADNVYIKKVWDSIVYHAYRYELFYFREGLKKTRSSSDHQAIIQAIADYDSEGAAKACRNNWINFFENRLKPRMEEEQKINDFLLYHKYY